MSKKREKNLTSNLKRWIQKQGSFQLSPQLRSLGSTKLGCGGLVVVYENLKISPTLHKVAALLLPSILTR